MPIVPVCVSEKVLVEKFWKYGGELIDGAFLRLFWELLFEELSKNHPISVSNNGTIASNLDSE